MEFEITLVTEMSSRSDAAKWHCASKVGVASLSFDNQRDLDDNSCSSQFSQ